MERRGSVGLSDDPRPRDDRDYRRPRPSAHEEQRDRERYDRSRNNHSGADSSRSQQGGGYNNNGPDTHRSGTGRDRDGGYNAAGGYSNRDRDHDDRRPPERDRSLERDADYASTRPPLSSSRPSASGSSDNYLSRRTGDDLRMLNDRLTRDLADKEEELRVLHEQTHKGLYQQKLQAALMDNQALRKRLDEISGFQTASTEQAEDHVSLLRELESVKNELSRSKVEYESLLDSQRHSAELLKDDLHAAEIKLGAHEREMIETEEENAQLHRTNDLLTRDNATLQQQLAQLKSGGRVNDLEEKLSHCTALLQSKESEIDTLLQEMDALTKENDALRSLQHEHIQEVQVRHGAELQRGSRAVEEKQLEIQSLTAELQAQLDRNKQLESFKHDHDATLLDLRSRLAEYEKGYNLTDAVLEIRTLKTALKKASLERQDERDLINRREKELQRYVAENRNLKRMAGIDDADGAWGLNADDLALHTHIELQKLQALHRTDVKIIAKLESDRLELLDELRKGSTDRTRDGFVFLGLDSAKTALLEDYVERLRRDDPSLPQGDQSEELSRKVAALSKDIDSWKDRYARSQVEKDEMAAKLLSLMERDKGMAYDQILKQITDLKVNYNLAALNQTAPNMQAAAAAAAQGGMLSPSHLQAIPESPGGARGLRSPSVNRAPSTPAQQQQQQQQAGSRLMSPRAGAAGPQTFVFPPTGSGASVPAGGAGGDPYVPSFDSASQHALLSLDSRALTAMDAGAKSRLLGALSELLAKERENSDLLDSLELYQIRFEKLSAKQQMLYIEYNNNRAHWADEKAQLQAKLDSVQADKEAVEMQLAKIRPLDAAPLAAADSASELEQLRRQVLVYATNEKVLSRRYNSLEQCLSTATAALSSTQREFIDMESTLKTRITELSKRKKILEGRNAAAQSLVKDWVPKEELFKLARKYNWLSSAYADAIAKQDLSLIARNETDKFRREVEELKEKSAALEVELAVQARKNADLEAALNTVHATMIPNPNPEAIKKQTLAAKMDRLSASQGKAAGSQSATLPSIPALLAEIADLRARESTSTKRCSRLDEHLAGSNHHTLQLEEELLSLRKKHHEVSTAFHAEQEIVLELRNKLEGAVPYHKANALQQALLEAQEKLVESQAAQEHLRQIADLANTQSIQLLNLHPASSAAAAAAGVIDGDSSSSSPPSAHEQLVASLRATIVDLESSSDDGARLGKLHRENMSLKLALRKADATVESARKDVIKAQQQMLLLERELDIKQTDLYRVHNEARSSLAEKERTILDLTSKTPLGSASALNHPMTLQQAETIHQATLSMQQQMEAANAKARESFDALSAAQLRVAELEIQLQEARELSELMPRASRSLASSQRRGTGAPKAGSVGAHGATFADDDDDDPSDPPLPASLSLTGQSGAALDAAEYSLKLRQQLVKYSSQVSALKLTAVKNQHLLSTHESKLAFQSKEIADYEAKLGALQQQLAERDLYITNKENSFQEQYMHLREMESKMKLEQSLARMHTKAKNTRAQNNAVQTIKRMQGDTAARDTDLRGRVDEHDDPFSVHVKDASGADVDVESLDLHDLAQLGDGVAGVSEGGGGGMLEGVLIQLQSKLRHAKEVMGDQRERISDLESEMARVSATKAADEAALTSAQDLAAMERARLLSTAQGTIASLNEQLSTKNDRIAKYQEMLESAAAKFKARKVGDEAEIERLNALLIQANSKGLGQINSAMNFLDELPRLPKDVVSRLEMDTQIKEKDALAALLQRELEFFKAAAQEEKAAREEIDQELKRLFSESSAEIAGLKKQMSLLEAGRTDDAAMSKLVDKLRADLHSKDASLSKLQDALNNLKESMAGDFHKHGLGATAAEAKEDAASMDPDSLRKQVQTLERKVKAQAAQITKDRQASAGLQSAAANHASELAAKDASIAGLESKLKDQVLELDGLRLRLAVSESAHTKLRESHLKHKAKLSKEVEELKSAHEKEKELAVRKDRLRDKLDGSKGRAAAVSQSKQEESKQDSAPNPSVSASVSGVPSASSAALASLAFAEWEGSKKAGERVSLLQRKVDKQAQEIKGLHEHIATLTARVSKEQSEKLALIQKMDKIQSAHRSHAKHFSNSLTLAMDAEHDDLSQGTLTDNDVQKLLTAESLRQRIFEQQDTIDTLQRRIEVDAKQAVMHARADAEESARKAEGFLREKREAERALRELQRSVDKPTRNKSSLTAAAVDSDSAALAQAEAALSASESKLLNATLSNLDLKYSVAHSSILVARLRTRLQECSNVIRLIDGNYLHNEWQELVPAEVRQMVESMRSDQTAPSSHAGAAAAAAAASSSSSRGVLGDKCAAPARALTVILSAYRKILEKLRSENDAAKKTAHSNVEFVAISKENKMLRKKVQALAEGKLGQATAQAHAGAPANTDSPAERDVNVVDRAELERAYSLHTLTRKELKKEQDVSAKLKKRLLECTRELEARSASLADLSAQSASAVSSEDSAAAFRRQKNLEASVADLTAQRDGAIKEAAVAKAAIKQLKAQAKDMGQIIQHVQNQQQRTQEQVLSAAAVQSAVLSATERESARDQQHAASLQSLLSDRARLSADNAALRQELSAFDVNFFEELEQLKYAYAQATQQVQQLTQQIEQYRKAEGNTRSE